MRISTVGRCVDGMRISWHQPLWAYVWRGCSSATVGMCGGDVHQPLWAYVWRGCASAIVDTCVCEGEVVQQEQERCVCVCVCALSSGAPM